MASRLGRIGAAGAVVGFLLLSAGGCGNDGSDGVVFTCENCEHWTKLVEGNARHPDFRPGGTDVLAFSSDRGSLENVENIWIVDLAAEGGAPVYYPITSSPNDDFDPAWAPDGERLTFTRATRYEDGTAGYELYLVTVDPFDNPGDEVRLTSTDVSDTTDVSRPATSSWLDNETILYSDGQNVYTITLDGNAPVAFQKVVNDPSDFIFSGTDDFVENQPTGVRFSDGDRFYFVSDSRVPLGSIAVQAFDVGGDTVHAEIKLEGVPTRRITPFVVPGRPAGTYLIGTSVSDTAQSHYPSDEDYCDTTLTLLVAVFENDTSEVTFTFSQNRGVLRLFAEPFGSKLWYDGNFEGSIRAETTYIACVVPGEVDTLGPDSVTYSAMHLVKIQSITDRDSLGDLIVDSAWVGVGIEDTTDVWLDATREGLYGGSGKSAGSVVLRPSRAPQGRTGVQQEGEPTLWTYDEATDSYESVSPAGEFPAYPAIDPTGRYLAYIVDFNSLKILAVDGTGEWWIPLPGATGINICYREAAFPAWSSDGTKIVLSLSPCTDQPSTDSNSGEFDVWEVDVAPFLGI